MSDLDLDTIHQAAYDYARRHGATQREAVDAANATQRAATRIARHIIEQAGFTPGRWRP